MNIQMRDRGQITLPSTVRKSLNLRKGSKISLSQVGNSFVLSKYNSLVKEAQNITKNKPYPIDEMLADLDVIRQEMYDEKYGHK